MLLLSSGDWASWVEAAGVWAVGILAGAIAWMQYRNSVFRPEATAYIEQDKRRRILVRITNQSSAAGTVEDVDLVTSYHDDAPLVDYEWEGWTVDAPVPFVLPGKTSAILILGTKQKLAADVRVRILYGSNKSSGCINLRSVSGRLAENTVLPPGSLALRNPPPASPPPTP